MNTFELEKIYGQLYAYTHSLLESYSWFGNNKGDSYLQGKQVEDYVMEAITVYLENPEKYNESKGRSLLNYIKYHIIRNLVRNDAVSSENQTATDFYESKGFDEDEDDSLQLNSLFPIIEPVFDQNIDYQKIMSEIELYVQNDIIASKIFQGICRDRLKRREVINDYDLSSSDFDNGMKRLSKVMKKMAQKYDLIQSQ